MNLRAGVMLVGCAAVSVASGQNFPMQVLAYEGQESPDGRSFVSVSEAEVSPSGEVVFWASAHSGDLGWSYTLYRWQAGAGLEKLVRSGDPTPGIPGSTFEQLWSYPRATVPGRTWFRARISAASHIDDTLWAIDAGDMMLIAREGDPALTTAPAVYGEDFGKLSASPSGMQVVFGNILRGGRIQEPNNGALFYAEQGVSRLLMQEGLDFSSSSPGVRVTGLTKFIMPVVTLDGQGVAAFAAEFDGPNVQPKDNWGIVMGRPAALEIAVRRGQTAPGAGDGMNFGKFRDTSINAAGRLAFSAELNREGMTSRDGEGVWVGPPDDLRLQIRDGETLPGVDGGATLYSFDRVIQNDNGDWTTLARTDFFNRDEKALLLAPSGDLPITIAYSGMQAPGFADGVVFGDETGSFDTPMLSPDGGLAFIASLAGPGIGDSNSNGLWAATSGGMLDLVLQAGSDLELAPGDVRTVLDVRLRDGGTTKNPFDQSFGPGGLLAATVQFTDRTRANVVFVVPGPGGLGVLLAGLALAHRRRR